MRLVGGMRTGGTNWDLDAFGELFGRLMSEVAHTGELTRFVGYEGVAGEDVHVRFLGIEVERIGDIPNGMVAWDVSDDIWTISDAQRLVWQSEPYWHWLDKPNTGRTIGEFAAVCPPDWGDSRLEFRLTAHAYAAPSGGGSDDDVRLVGYDPSWPERYGEMARWIQDKLGGVALRVEHYGSTAIPGMPAKPVIDILVEIPSFAEAHRRVLPLLNDPEWEYWSYREHMTFVKRAQPFGTRTHHLHMAPAGHAVWNGLAFRDYLKAHPKEAAQYANLKRDLAECHRTDRERYTEAKSEFVRQVTEKALRTGG